MDVLFARALFAIPHVSRACDMRGTGSLATFVSQFHGNATSVMAFLSLIAISLSNGGGIV